MNAANDDDVFAEFASEDLLADLVDGTPSLAPAPALKQRVLASAVAAGRFARFAAPVAAALDLPEGVYRLRQGAD